MRVAMPGAYPSANPDARHDRFKLPRSGAAGKNVLRAVLDR